ncbi:MAG: hypothetical protein GF308_14795 [Candidatus Heimdallarchaeota archaeon]|nr:hypothetical protein [Candidatus Heimdallarchaeota archaeon]
MRRKLTKNRYRVDKNQLTTYLSVVGVGLLLLGSTLGIVVVARANEKGTNDGEEFSPSPLQKGTTAKVGVRRVAKMSKDWNYSGIEVRESLAYLFKSVSLAVWDVSQPKHPVPLGKYEEPNHYFRDFHVSKANKHLGGVIIQQENGSEVLALFNLTNPRQPVKLAEYQSNGTYLYDFVFYYDYLYLSTYEGTEIISVTNPRQPVQVANISSVNIYRIQGNFAYGLAEEKLVVLNLVQPEEPKIIGEINREHTYMVDMAVTRKYAVLVYQRGIVEIFTINDPKNPSFVGEYVYPDWEFDPGGIIRGVEVTQEQAFVFGLALSVFEISDPTNIKRIKRKRPPCGSHIYTDLSISEGYLYLMSIYSFSLEIFALVDRTIIWQYLGIGVAVGIALASPGIIVLTIKIRRKKKERKKQKNKKKKVIN